MLANLARHQVVVNGIDQYSTAVAMSGNNTANAGITVLSNTATSLTINIQGSNDLQGWKDSTADTGFVLGFNATANRALAFAYCRLKYTVVGTGTIILAAELNTSRQ